MSSRVIRVLRRLYHYLVYVAGGLVIAACIVALAFKFWVMPNISSYEGMLEDVASKALGQHVDIGGLEAGWRGPYPSVTVRDVRMSPAAAGAAAAPLLLLPRVEARFSWLSLILFDLRLASLNLDQPRLTMKRDAAGVITLAGIPINQPSAPSPFPDWLLKQPRIVVKDAEITWRDDLLDAPELRFAGVRLLLENRFGRHRFGGIAQPTAAAARRFELRGDLKGRSLHDWSAWSGEIYARIDGARFESWGRWVPWAQDSVKSGLGDMRFWLALNQGVVLGLTGDVRLDRVAVNIEKALPDLKFDSLTGHAGWARKQDAHTFFVERLRFKTPGEALSEPANIRVNLTPDQHGGFKRFGVNARNLRLEALTALAGALPIPKRGHDLIQALNPRGLVNEADGHWTGAKDYALKLDIRSAGVNAYAEFPGINGLDARIEADPHGGRAAFDGAGMKLDLPLILRHELSFSQLAATADWKFDAAGMSLSFDARKMVNSDLEGSAQGRLEIPDSGPVHADISAHLTRGEANAVYRYLPLKVGDDAYHWLQRGLISGKSDDVRLVLKGPLDRFPFDQGGGEFSVSIRMLNGVLDYAPGWPRIEGVNGTLLFHDKAMSLNAYSGRILDARLGPVKVFIPDLHSSIDEMLMVDGQAAGETRTFLDFIRFSPVHEHTGHFTEPFKAVGDGRLDLHLRIPLRKIEATTLSGSYAFDNNRLDPGGDLPELSAVSGSVQFTQDGLQAKDIHARLLDLPVRLNIRSALASENGQGAGRAVLGQLYGEIGAAEIAPYLPAALRGRLAGGTRWQAEVGMNAGGKSEFKLTSDLVGLAINLPVPLGKTAEMEMPLSAIKESVNGGAKPGASVGDGVDAVLVRYGDLLSLRAQRPKDGPARVHVHFGGGEATAPTDSGLWISGALRQLDLDAWKPLMPAARTPAAADAGVLPLREANIVFNELQLFNRRLNDTHIKLRPSAGGWRLAVTGREIAGEVATVPVGNKVNVLANFKRLSVPDILPGKKQARSVGSDDTLVSLLAGLDLSADSFVMQNHDLGELHLRLAPDNQATLSSAGLRMENFQLKNADGVLRGKGVLADHPRRQTRFEFELESTNLGNLFDRLGMPGRLKRAAGSIVGPLSWTGRLEDFNLATLAGDLTLNLKRGQFTKLDPGAGKLLGILSLQSLPRRITLDFRDVFSEGFAFDEISGNVHLERGSAYFKDLRMNGPAAKVSMSGVADLASETQNLRVTIQPRLEDTVAVAGALLGGPVVGVGTFLANKILQNPIGQAATFEYIITGAWADPLVNKVVKPKTGAAARP